MRSVPQLEHWWHCWRLRSVAAAYSPKSVEGFRWAWVNACTHFRQVLSLHRRSTPLLYSRWHASVLYCFILRTFHSPDITANWGSGVAAHSLLLGRARGGIAMVKRAQPAAQMSSTRQKTLMHDRARTRAVSLYLADHRDSLLEMVPSKIKKNRNQKRKELERLARQHFNTAPQNTQQTYYDKVEFRSAGDHEVGMMPLAEFRSSGGESKSLELKTSGEEPLVEFQSAGDHEVGMKPLAEFRSSGDDVAPLLHAVAGHPTASSDKRRAIDRQSMESSDAGWSAMKPAGQGCLLKDSLLRESKHLRTLYGESGALETLASAMRILDVVDMQQWKSRKGVKLAVVVGMAAKLMPTPTDEKHVRKLWAKLAGESSELEVRKLEKEVLMAWARKGLSDGGAMLE